MTWKPVTLEDKEIINRHLKVKNYGVSDLSFTNFYLWHFSRAITYAILDGFLCIKTQYPDEAPFYFLPVGEGELAPILEKLIEESEQEGYPFSLRAITPEMKESLESAMPDQFLYEEQRDRFDYLFSVSELTELKGRKYHKKKNHVNRFKNNYLYCYEPIDSSNKDEVKATWDAWFHKLENPDQGIINEKLGIDHALDHLEQMDFTGGLLRIEGNVMAFSFGEMLNEESVVIHIEKADISYHGAYQAINQIFLEQAWQDALYVNREEDLGIEGLRKAKLSYHPVGFVEKYKVTLK